MPVPEPGPGQLLMRVQACGVCRTDLHLLDGEVEIAAPAARPRPPDRRAPSRRAARAPAAAAGGRARRRSVARAGPTATCEYCTSGRENLCPNARFTGRDIDGGFAEYTVADERFCFPLPAAYSDEQARAAAVRGADRLPRAAHVRRGAAPRASTASAPPRTSSPRSRAGRAARCTRSPAPATTPPRPSRASSARSGRAPPTRQPPEPLDAAIIFAPVGAARPGSRCARSRPAARWSARGIHMSDIPSFPYEILWEERVAALGRQPHPRATARSCSRSRPQVPVRTQRHHYPLRARQRRARDLRAGASPARP